jgi:hypothetical protein
MNRYTPPEWITDYAATSAIAQRLNFLGPRDAVPIFDDAARNGEFRCRGASTLQPKYEVELEPDDWLLTTPDGEPIYYWGGGVEVHRASFHKWLNRIDVQASAGKGGRPLVHDWPAAHGFAVTYIVENDYPATRGEMERVIREWFQRTADKCPDARQIERFVSAIYDARTAK